LAAGGSMATGALPSAGAGMVALGLLSAGVSLLTKVLIMFKIYNLGLDLWMLSIDEDTGG
ncbi:hypothetical protein AB9E19_33695, partial [Rhizobium leguminosarum]|uniref:hypothetical protein n=1 Tax=Rhizobium leguminosarum TaxID=384 RepID=UPI003F9BD205